MCELFHTDTVRFADSVVAAGKACGSSEGGVAHRVIRQKAIQALAIVGLSLLAMRASAQEPTAHATKALADLPPWKTVTVGTYSTVEAVRDALDQARISLGDWANEILGRPAFTFSAEPRPLNLIVLSMAQLGFDDNRAALADVHARAIWLGLELCPGEVGPYLRLQYLDQPVGEFLRIGMLPHLTYDGEFVDFTLGNGGTGLALLGGRARPDMVVPQNVAFVFVQPDPYQASR